MRDLRAGAATRRVAGALVICAALLVPIAGCGGADAPAREASSTLCDALELDLGLAVVPPSRPPAGEQLVALRPAKCDISMRRQISDALPGAAAGSSIVVSARADLVPGFSPEGLVRVRAAAEATPNSRIVALPALGTDAFLVIRKDLLGGANDEALAADPIPTGRPVAGDPTTALPLPITAHWRVGDMLWTVAANRSGANRTETRRLILRLAALLNRRPIDGGRAGSTG